MSRYNATYIKHTERWTACRTRASTTQPDLWLRLILSTGEPSAHALEAPHRSTLAAATWWCRVSVINTTSSQLDARHSLHATDALIQQLIHTQPLLKNAGSACHPPSLAYTPLGSFRKGIRIKLAKNYCSPVHIECHHPHCRHPQQLSKIRLTARHGTTVVNYLGHTVKLSVGLLG